MSATETGADLRIDGLGAADVEPAADVLNEAFLADPVWTSIGPRRRAHRRFANRTIFRGIVDASRRNGARARVARSGSRVVGVSIAFVPGSWPLPQSALAYELRWLALVGPAPALRGFRNDRTIRRRHPLNPLMYLWFLGVDPQWHGRGVGRALLAEVHADSDALGLPTYLETGTERNVGFYEGDGYVVEGEVALPSGVPMWLMERPLSPIRAGEGRADGGTG